VKNTDDDLRELRRLLRAPAERDFPSGRMREREEHLLRSLRELSGQGKRAGLARADRRWAVAGGGVAAVLLGAAVFALAPTATAAYTVTTRGDGTVSVVVNNVGEPTEANEALRRAGVRATVMLPEPATECPAADRPDVTVLSFGSGKVRLDMVRAPEMATIVESTSHANEVLIHPNAIPAGQILLLVPVVAPGGPILQIAVSPAPGPRCMVDLTWWDGPIVTTRDPSEPGPTVSRSFR
jgi:hypothetical protein